MKAIKYYNNMIMPFGKHKGRELQNIPRAYLEWLRERTNLNKSLQHEVDYYLEDPMKRRKRVKITISCIKCKVVHNNTRCTKCGSMMKMIDSQFT